VTDALSVQESTALDLPETRVDIEDLHDVAMATTIGAEHTGQGRGGPERHSAFDLGPPSFDR
jgi:hypothetical protein